MRLDGSDQMWVACALARLGRMDLVLRKVERLPEETVITAVAAPFASFRDQASSAARLDYRLLEDFIDRYPVYVPALAAELRPGRAFCEITVEEVDEALRGLTSPHLIVRQHAACVLGERRLGRSIARRVLPQLARAAGHDPDADVRRLAILSLAWWRQDARPYADVIRKALDDPSPSVRGVAADWLRDEGSGQAN